MLYMCLTPMTKKKKLTGYSVPIACGKCPDCIARRISGWSFRLIQESKRRQSHQFITLTYDTDHVPFNQQGQMVLNKRDLQLFFKRLRKAHDKPGIRSKGESKTIKYFAVGEYGSESLRPHYHVILFNARIELIQDAWGKEVVKKRYHNLKTGKKLKKPVTESRKQVHFGMVHFGDVNGASIGYSLKYMCKEPKHESLIKGLPKQFQLQSQGLGKNYVTHETVQWHLTDIANRMYLTTEQGHKIAMPRYYKELIYPDETRKAISVIIEAKNSKEAKQELIEEYKEFKKLGYEKYFSKHQKIRHNETERTKAEFRKYRAKAKEGRNKI